MEEKSVVTGNWRKQQNSKQEYRTLPTFDSVIFIFDVQTHSRRFHWRLSLSWSISVQKQLEVSSDTLDKVVFSPGQRLRPEAKRQIPSQAGVSPLIAKIRREQIAIPSTIQNFDQGCHQIQQIFPLSAHPYVRKVNGSILFKSTSLMVVIEACITSVKQTLSITKEQLRLGPHFWGKRKVSLLAGTH